MRNCHRKNRSLQRVSKVIQVLPQCLDLMPQWQQLQQLDIILSHITLLPHCATLLSKAPNSLSLSPSLSRILKSAQKSKLIPARCLHDKRRRGAACRIVALRRRLRCSSDSECPSMLSHCGGEFSARPWTEWLRYVPVIWICTLLHYGCAILIYPPLFA